MSLNGSETLKQFSPGQLSRSGGGGKVDTHGVVSGVVYQKLLFGNDEANATPMTGYEDDSSVATGITEDGLDDDGSVMIIRYYITSFFAQVQTCLKNKHGRRIVSQTS